MWPSRSCTGRQRRSAANGGELVAATQGEDGLEEDALIRDEREIERGALSFDVD